MKSMVYGNARAQHGGEYCPKLNFPALDLKAFLVNDIFNGTPPYVHSYKYTVQEEGDKKDKKHGILHVGKKHGPCQNKGGSYHDQEH